MCWVPAGSVWLTRDRRTTPFYAFTDANGSELWKSDGTNAGTVLVKDIQAGPGSSVSSDLMNVNGTLFFTANTTTEGNELWKSDGTTAGTLLVQDINRVQPLLLLPDLRRSMLMYISMPPGALGT